MSEERIQKILSRLEFGSRRACEALIEEGRVLVNGKRAELGAKADPLKDIITVNGQRIKFEEPELIYIAVYKPRGILSSPDPVLMHKEGSHPPRRTVLDLIGADQRLFPIGRLDAESEGLMIMTNDGALANRLMHPRYGHEKEYRVLIARQPDEEQIAALRHGIVLEDGYRTLPARIWIDEIAGKGCYMRFVLKEGRKRQIREMCRRIGLPIVRLVRIRIGPLRLGNLKRGDWRYLSEQEVQDLRESTYTKMGENTAEGVETRGRTTRKLSHPEKRPAAGKPPSRRKQRPSGRSAENAGERPSRTQEKPARNTPHENKRPPRKDTRNRR